MRRRKRTERRSGVRVQLTGRDHAVLAALARFGVASSAALASVAFRGVSRQAVSRRLRRLHDAGFITARVPVLAGPNLYVLGPTGRRWASERGLAPARLPRALPHRLAVIDTWTAIAAAGTCGATLYRFRPEWELGPELRTAVIPDAIAELAFPCPSGEAHRVRLLVEVDTGSEPGSVLRRKLERYALLAVSGNGEERWDDTVLAFVMPGASRRRAAMLAGLLEEAWTGHAVLWTNDEGLKTALRALRKAVAATCCNGCNREGTASDDFSRLPEAHHLGH